MSSSPRIMLVEDSETQAIKLTHVLQEQGWDVLWVSSAEQAIAEIDRDPPRLILIDYYLPGIRGDELCRKIRLHINTRSIPVIMLTANQENHVELQGLDSGADDFVQKSADPDILVLRIRTLLRKDESQSSIVAQADSFFRQARLLTIDDSDTYLEYLAGELQADGYDIDATSSPSEGLERIVNQQYDCVLVDLVMPELNGIEVCRQINRIRQQMKSPIAVLMLTGQEDKEQLTQALEAGADDFVGKSNDITVLKGRIRALLRRKFFQEENRRILEELKNKELEALRAHTEREAAEARAELKRQRQALAMMDEIQRTKDELERANEALLQSNDELKQFAYLTSHDLQEPLRSVASYCQLLRDRYDGQLDEQADRWIQKVIAGVGRMKSMIQDLLSYCRVERQGRPLKPTDCNEACKEAIANLRAAIEENAAQIVQHSLPTIHGDATQIRHLFQNLIGNAIKYRGQQQPQITISAHARDDEWIITVRDNGIGIAAEFHDKIFEVFKRLHSKDEYPGTGIGLALCQRIAHRHGGRIWVESSPDRGSTFSVALPASRAVQRDGCPPTYDVESVHDSPPAALV